MHKLDKRNAWKERYEPDPNSGCWLWLGSINNSGYGQINVKGFSPIASRAFYQLHVGDIPVGMEVCHRCDTPSCVNPNHLWLGTKLQNQQDSKAKGRRPTTFGEKNPCARLTQEQVVRIYSDTRVLSVIAADYGVERSTIHLIQKGKKWGAVTKGLRKVKRTHRWDPMGAVLVDP